MLHGDLTTGRRAYRDLELVRVAQATLVAALRSRRPLVVENRLSPAYTTPARETRLRSRANVGTSNAFDRAPASFAETYADQNEQDYAVFKAAVSCGWLHARTASRLAYPPSC
jgi:Uncharacterized protein conserved in bacteria (DUF2252)